MCTELIVSMELSNSVSTLPQPYSRYAELQTVLGSLSPSIFAARIKRDSSVCSAERYFASTTLFQMPSITGVISVVLTCIYR